MKPTEIAKVLENYNEWRRGKGDAPPVTPYELGVAIDFAVVDLKYSLRVSDVIALVDSMSEFDTEEERELFMEELRVNLNGL